MLNLVIFSRVKNQQVPEHVYRKSTLTNLLQDSLGGKSLLIILACVSLAESNYEDTLLTLQYAGDTKQMKNKLITVEDPRTAEARPARNQQLILDEKENKRLLAIIADTQSQLKLAPHEAQQTELQLQKVKDELANNMKEKKNTVVTVIVSDFAIQVANALYLGIVKIMVKAH
ncbi:hypothetical protein DAPPUDRAFT_331047 [Daphnia pulex]|uniref:Kinesin motor domain-containing protein n=1 Tax=Daphnia pulex TaxID=6669 RepID=E9HLC4_DAPPU|nr:hypothetical protein DAPPUDRAFT_331047 [Daphnia pulex]|eukprot:EFX67456.1 hypothetical protein DAPPUDRAFT_331047 [Daphnia pulex]